MVLVVMLEGTENTDPNVIPVYCTQKQIDEWGKIDEAPAETTGADPTP